ncbi:MAG: molecular chaperone Hsp33 [Gammaproteobacteria bacterium]|jgi:molecular chaperone Hsp33
MSGDVLARFLLESSNVRGEFIQLDETWQEILQRANYPDPVRRLLGEAVSAVALMAATIKFDGSLILQIRGSGPVHMLVAQSTGKHTLRGLARWRGDDVVDGTLPELIGEGQMIITIDPGPGKDRYQSIINLDGDSLAEALDQYFLNSEQLPTRFWLASNAQRCAGFLLQRLPKGKASVEEVEPDDEAWNYSVAVSETLTEEEMLGWPAPELLRRLFPEHPVRLFDGPTFTFRCGCSREVIETTLRALGPVELAETLHQEGVIRVDCEFCAARYDFDAVDVEQLFASQAITPADETRH